MRSVVLIPRWAVLAFTVAAMVLSVPVVATVKASIPANLKTADSIIANDDNDDDHDNDHDNDHGGDPICNYLSETNQKHHNSCATNTNRHQDRYEPPEIEWCRRRPTWRIGKTEKGKQKNEEQVGDESILEIETSTKDVRSKCRRVLGYETDPKLLTRDKEPELSSTYNFPTRLKDDEFTDGSEESDETYYKLPVLERPLFRRIETCMDGILATSPISATATTRSTMMKKSTVARLHRREDGLVAMAVVEDALSEEEAEAVFVLARCVKRFLPSNFQRREFEFTIEGGGNDVTYLSGFLQLLAPGVAYRVQKTAHLVWEAAGWEEGNALRGNFQPVDISNDNDYYYKETKTKHKTKNKNNENETKSEFSTSWWPNPISECGIRTTEHLSYDRWGGLGYHKDSGSDYTVLMALSDPDDYEGGSFSFCPEYDPEQSAVNVNLNNGRNCPNKISTKPNKLSAIVFLSEFSHGVEDIHTPGRVMFANELWRYYDVPVMDNRPSPSEFVLGIDEDDDKDDGLTY